MNDIVFREFAGSGRGKAEMESAVEFDLCRLTIRGNEAGIFQELKPFFELKSLAGIISVEI